MFDQNRRSDGTETGAEKSACPLFFSAALLACAVSVAMLAGCASAPEAGPPSAVPAAEPEDAAETLPPDETAAFDGYAFAAGLLARLDAGDYAGALAYFDSLPEPEASLPEMQKLRLSVLVSAGDLEAAATLAARLEAETGGDDPDVLYAQAVIASAENRPAERTRLLKRMVELDPQNTDALMALGEDSFGRKAYGDARKWYQQAVEADAGNPEAHRGLAHSYYLQDKLPEARAAVDQALAAHPDSAALWAESALIRSEQRQLPAALDDMRRALELDPEEPYYWGNYGVLLVKASKLSEARDAFTEAIRLNPEDTFPYIYRCGLNDTLGYTEEALRDYRFVCEHYPQYYYAAEGLGVLLWLQGDYAGAKAAFGQACEYAPDNVSYALMYTLCCYELKENDEARRFIGRFMNTLDRSSPEYFVCRLFYDRSGDADVLGRVNRLQNEERKGRLMFYIACYYELFQSESLAQKFYSQITDTLGPTFFEYRLAGARAENAAQPAEISGI